MQTKPLKPATTYPAIVGGVLAQIRNQSGLRQEELAQALGITQATLSRIEKGQSSITVEHLRLAAQKLGHTPAVILSYADQTEVNMQTQGITVAPTRDSLNKTLVIIGAAALLAIIAAAIISSQKS
jgi:transcriptional regulator with XRE-family HTH domain